MVVIVVDICIYIWLYDILKVCLNMSNVAPMILWVIFFGTRSVLEENLGWLVECNLVFGYIIFVIVCENVLYNPKNDFLCIVAKTGGGVYEQHLRNNGYPYILEIPGDRTGGTTRTSDPEFQVYGTISSSPDSGRVY